MDADRKSTASSFYGRRKSSIDVLNKYSSDEYPPQPVERGRDDASSFFSPPTAPRSSIDYLNPPTSAGYNIDSFPHGRKEPLKGGRDEEDAWDVYADFNNAGPRYSSAFGRGQSSVG